MSSSAGAGFPVLTLQEPDRVAYIARVAGLSHVGSIAAIVSSEHRRPLLFPDPDVAESTFLGDFFRRETVGGAIALLAAALAVVWANSPWSASYDELRAFVIGPLDVEHWAADGALTLFFFVAGLELKREFTIGSLRKPADAAVPVVAAACGVAVPAVIYLTVNGLHPDGVLDGWAIPAATDIAFALAVLAVVGSNLPTALRAFLLTLAVVDDLIVIMIIAIFFTSTLHVLALVGALVAFAAWAVLQRLRVRTPFIYVPLAVAAWWLVHESGIHATIAGVVLGLLTRVRRDPGETTAPAERLEHLLSPLSSAVAVPFFALMSAGVVVSGGLGLVQDPVVIGVFLGLVVGKPIGVLGGRVPGHPVHPRRAQPRTELARRRGRRRARRHRVHGVPARRRPLLRRSREGRRQDRRTRRVPGLRGPRRPDARPPRPLPPHPVGSVPAPVDGRVAFGATGVTFSGRCRRRAPATVREAREREGPTVLFTLIVFFGAGDPARGGRNHPRQPQGTARPRAAPPSRHGGRVPDALRQPPAQGAQAAPCAVAPRPAQAPLTLTRQKLSDGSARSL